MNSLNNRLVLKEILVMPPGLKELMNDISREVLRCNPTNLCTFIADYLDSLLITRENAKAAQKIAEHIEEKSHLITRVCGELDLTLEKGQSVAKLIQKGFQDYVSKTTVEGEYPPLKYDISLIYDKLIKNISLTKEDFDTLATIIQRAYRSYRIRKIRSEQNRPLDWQAAYNRTDYILEECEVSHEERQRAATLIQAAYKGYYIRKLVRSKTHRPEDISSSEIINDVSVIALEKRDMLLECDNISIRDYDSIMFEIQTKAASVIQKAYRQHKSKIKKYGEIDSVLQNLSLADANLRNSINVEEV